MKNSLIIPLKEAKELEQVGGKAVNLYKLMQAKLPVPDGFVISTEAFRSAVDGKVSDELTDDIKNEFSKLNSNFVAARSSATAEDMAGASMAGQYETYLNLSSAEELISGIEKCWKSLRSERTTAYLKEHGLDLEQVAMAVVVQKQVQADVSGVLFTVDPKTGCREEMLIEAAWGLGEGLVSGEVQPDLICINSHEGEVKSYHVADKVQAMFPGKKGFLPVEESLRKKACLTYEQIVSLQKLGQLSEKYFNYPQDIEWAIEQNEVYMLQTRPITTLEEADSYNSILKNIKVELKEQADEGHGPWVRHNLGETLPHPTPFTWDLVSKFMSGDGGFGQMYKDLGFKPGPKVLDGKSFLKNLGGQVYMDCSLMTEMFSENYPYLYDAEKLKENPDASQSPPTLPNGSMKELNEAAEQSISVSKKLGELAVNLDKEFDEEFVQEVLKWVKEQEEVDLKSLSETELIELWNKQSAKVMTDFGNKAFMPSMVEALALENLKSFLEEHSWNEDPERLLSIFSVSSKLDRTLLSNIDLADINSGKVELADWLNEHGHRAPGEFELATPRWIERPEDVKALAKQMKGEKKLAEIHEQRLGEASQALEKLKLELSSKQYADLTCRVDLVQRYCRFREDGKYYLMKAYSVLRTTSQEFTQRLHLGDDLYFLNQNEVFEALNTGFVPKDKITKRRTAYQVEKRLHLPHVISEDNLNEIGSPAIQQSGDFLKAHSVSNGTCKGVVAIVSSPEEVKSLPEGAVLVCPSTDPSWTPLFVNSSGLVLERGGALSHGAVVAREMGLPAVVIDGATKILKEGEEITVDADSGCIYRQGADKEIDPSMDVNIERALVPPPVSSKESKANRLGVLAAVLWGIILAGIYLLPEQVLHNPVISLIDAAIWPLIRQFGMVWAVAFVAVLFAVIPILMQKYLTDNKRLYEGKMRSNLLLKEAKKFPEDSPRRKKMEELASPITMRVLKVSMVPLAFILGPMMMIFMWFPDRVDPLSWSAEPGRMVSIVAEIDGDTKEGVTLTVPTPLSLNNGQSEMKSLPPIRQELEELRHEWRNVSDMEDLPWEVQSAGDSTRQIMLASLNSFLSEGIPAQKVSWRVNVPENAVGAHHVNLLVGDKEAASFNLVFGQVEAPEVGTIFPSHDALKSVTVNYPRSLHKGVFWAPLAKIGGPAWDFGWLGVYLLVYLPLMFIAKILFKVP